MAMTHNKQLATSPNRGRHLEAVPDLPQDATYSVPEAFETPIVREIRPPKAFSLRHIQSIQSLPDNVYLLREEPPELTA